MGLSVGSLAQLIRLRRAGRLHDRASVLEIGAQQLSNEFLRARELQAELYGLFGRAPLNLGEPRDAGMIDGGERQHPNAPMSRAFWESLGLSYISVEYDGRGDSVPFNLNSDTVPPDLRAAVDLVVNAGTTEHVINQENAFRSIHDFTKPGGVMMHEVPGGGLPTHGLVGYNAQFFWLLCRENQYEVLDLTVQHLRTATINADVIGSNAQFGHSDRKVAADLKLPVLFVRALLSKVGDGSFVTPLDVPV